MEYGDWNTITPKFIAFSGPSGVKAEIFPGLYSMVPSDYFDIWRRKGVGAVVRLNKKNYQVKGEIHNTEPFRASARKTPEL